MPTRCLSSTSPLARRGRRRAARSDIAINLPGQRHLVLGSHERRSSLQLCNLCGLSSLSSLGSLCDLRSLCGLRSIVLVRLLCLLDLLRLLRAEQLGILPRARAWQGLLWHAARRRVQGAGALHHDDLRVVLHCHGPGLLRCEVRVLGLEPVLQLPNMHHDIRGQLLRLHHRSRRR